MSDFRPPTFCLPFIPQADPADSARPALASASRAYRSASSRLSLTIGTGVGGFHLRDEFFAICTTPAQAIGVHEFTQSAPDSRGLAQVLDRFRLSPAAESKSLQ